MYPTVPITIPGSVAGTSVGPSLSAPLAPLPDCGCASFAKPKSRILTSPSSPTITFSGFRSRCTIPAPCALASPSAICTAICSNCRTGSAPFRSERNGVPFTSSIAMYEIESADPMS